MLSAPAARQASPVLQDVLARAADPHEWERFEHQLRATGYCRRPVRLAGVIEAVDTATGECRTTYSTATEPDGTLLKCCGNRREAVCPSCAERYRGDAFQLVASGLRGGKGTPESVAGHPTVFVTITAPSFGHVHSRRLRNGEAQRCRPRRRAETCPHGVRMSCGAIHDADHACLGEPLCPECFDYELAVLWNAMAPELWRRTAIQLPRELARLCGLPHRELRRRVRVSYVKVAEYQRRGALHFHCVIRVDQAQARDRGHLVEPPATDFTVELLADAIEAAIRHVAVRTPATAGNEQGREVRWGAELELRPLDASASEDEAGRCAGYIAKYATKSTEAVGGLTSRLSAAELRSLRVPDHARRYIESAWRLGSDPDLRRLRLRRWAHTLGFRGHCFTKSRRYSTTFTALRRARNEHVLAGLHPDGRRDPWGRDMAEGASHEMRRFRFVGAGYRTLGDTWLAECAGARAREQRAIAREELRTGPAGAVLQDDTPRFRRSERP
jgi:hypothetical protein